MSKKRKTRSKQDPKMARRIKQLEAELKRKEAALAEAAALLLLSKKVEALWAEEDAGTAQRREKRSSK
jgi:predicted RND superfamily exporter protein